MFNKLFKKPAVPIFGTSIDVQILADMPRKWDFKTAEFVPAFLQLLIKTLSTIDALETPGIFRTTASIKDVKALKTAVENANSIAELPEFSSQKTDPQVISLLAALAKLWLKELVDCVIPNSHFAVFLAAHLIPNELATACKALPKSNRLTLKSIIEYLVLLSTHSATNKMDSKNLAIVFGPTLLRNESIDNLVADTLRSSTVISTMIDNFNIVFGNPGKSDHAVGASYEKNSNDHSDMIANMVSNSVGTIMYGEPPVNYASAPVANKIKEKNIVYASVPVTTEHEEIIEIYSSKNKFEENNVLNILTVVKT